MRFCKKKKIKNIVKKTTKNLELHVTSAAGDSLSCESNLDSSKYCTIKRQECVTLQGSGRNESKSESQQKRFNLYLKMYFLR